MLAYNVKAYKNEVPAVMALLYNKDHPHKAVKEFLTVSPLKFWLMIEPSWSKHDLGYLLMFILN